MKAFDGYWKITWMQEWDRDFVDLVEPGHFRFEGDIGNFVFGAVTGQLDLRYGAEGDHVAFSWAGMDEGDDVSGRGWLQLTAADTAEGRLLIHLGDESDIRLERRV
ncbi:MAG: hypothetical protein PF501_18690 [Salinisphaera sp.]|jgi:hypothetical protein|nr:hypothetical protein [Salinisphaera sp.]